VALRCNSVTMIHSGQWLSTTHPPRKSPSCAGQPGLERFAGGN